MSTNSSPSGGPSSRVAPLAALRYRDFRLLWLGTLVATIGAQMRIVAVNWHVYDLARSGGGIDPALALGLIGLARVLALVLVAPFVDPVPVYPELDPFTVGLPELPALAARIDRRVVLRSDFDPEVPIELAPAVIEGLSAEEVVVPEAGHFCQSQGVTTLPVLLEHLR